MEARYRFNQGSLLTSMIPIMVFLMALTGSYVFIEPAPVDLITLGVAGLLFFLGLRIPRGFLLPLFFLVLFLLGNFIATSVAADIGASLIYTAVTTYLVIALVMYMALMYWDYQRLMKYFWRGYILAAIIAASAAIIGFFQLVPGYEMFVRYDRASATFKDPNVYGPYLVAVILYLINSFEDETARGKFVGTGLVLFLVLALFISFSRGAIGNFLFSLSLMIFVKIRLKNSMKTLNRYFLGGTTVMVLVIASLVVGVLMSERLQTMVEIRGKVVQEYDVKEGGRFNTQKEAIHYALANPIGSGPGDSDVVLGLEPHNVYLLVLVETGVIGFIGWVGFFGLTVIRATSFLRRAVFIPKDFLPIYAALMGTVLESFIIDSIHWRHLFVLSGIAWGLMLASRYQQSLWLANNSFKSKEQLHQALGAKV